ncbi:MAG TPA: hypothetical protein VFI79_13600, partial [Gemmatimonadales bacterium]|nr:hypothetical protein [Gemmatimonadales bacterium]
MTTSSPRATGLPTETAATGARLSILGRNSHPNRTLAASRDAAPSGARGITSSNTTSGVSRRTSALHPAPAARERESKARGR